MLFINLVMIRLLLLVASWNMPKNAITMPEARRLVSILRCYQTVSQTQAECGQNWRAISWDPHSGWDRTDWSHLLHPFDKKSESTFSRQPAQYILNKIWKKRTNVNSTGEIRVEMHWLHWRFLEDEMKDRCCLTGMEEFQLEVEPAAEEKS
jgi:hypothetical protein